MRGQPINVSLTSVFFSLSLSNEKKKYSGEDKKKDTLDSHLLSLLQQAILEPRMGALELELGFPTVTEDLSPREAPLKQWFPTLAV